MNKAIRYSLLAHKLKNQQSFALIDFQKPSPLIDYTFLESNLQLIPIYLRPMVTGFSTKSTSSFQKYLKQVQRLVNKLVLITNQQMNAQTLYDKDVNNLSKMFTDVKFNLQNQTNKLLSNPVVNKISQVSFLTGAFNMLQLSQWNKIIVMTSQNYKNMDIAGKDKILQVIYLYLKKYSYPTNDRVQSNKFVMKQTHLHDVGDLSFFVKCSQQLSLFKNQQIDFGQRLSIFKNKMALIKKLSKSLNMKYYYIRQQFQQVKNAVLDKLQFLTLQQLLDIYQFYAKLSLDTPDFIQKIQNMLENRLKNYSGLTNIMRKLLSTRFLATWKHQQRYNKNIFQNFIRPTIQYEISNVQNWRFETHRLQSKFLIHTAYSLICCSLHGTGLSERILDLVSRTNNNFDNKSYRILQDYMNFKKLKKQGNDLTPILNQYLSKAKKQQSQKPQYQPIQYNPAQFFWQTTIRRVVPIQNIFKSIYISGFQIDILVFYKDRYFAFQVKGSHYKAGSGSKRIKEQIMACFGIKMIVIDCNQTDVKIIMRLKKIDNAEKYIMRLLEGYISQVQSVSTSVKN